MKCFYPGCVSGPLFRINEKGVPGIWACREHIKNTDAPPIHESVDRVVRAIEGKKP